MPLTFFVLLWGASVIGLGMALLITTPVVRVALSAFFS
jgi:uncharacterized membrane protein